MQYFHMFYRQQLAHTKLGVLQREDRTILEDSTDILKEFFAFYRNLYAGYDFSDSNLPHLSHALNSVGSRLDADQRAFLDDGPTDREISDIVLALPSNKAPGVDSFNADGLKAGWSFLGAIPADVSLFQLTWLLANKDASQTRQWHRELVQVGITSTRQLISVSGVLESLLPTSSLLQVLRRIGPTIFTVSQHAIWDTSWWSGAPLAATPSLTGLELLGCIGSFGSPCSHNSCSMSTGTSYCLGILMIGTSSGVRSFILPLGSWYRFGCGAWLWELSLPDSVLDTSGSSLHTVIPPMKLSRPCIISSSSAHDGLLPGERLLLFRSYVLRNSNVLTTVTPATPFQIFLSSTTSVTPTVAVYVLTYAWRYI
ncbi:hypothetical protein R1sor_008207 [Riccia sorocarpa]|uniref:Maturase K n=1 Tax=Riccia sorocarpa TaxID=122646 RepID=A0ABD3HWV8_9MARC